MTTHLSDTGRLQSSFSSFICSLKHSARRDLYTLIPACALLVASQLVLINSMKLPTPAFKRSHTLIFSAQRYGFTFIVHFLFLSRIESFIVINLDFLSLALYSHSLLGKSNFPTTFKVFEPF